MECRENGFEHNNQTLRTDGFFCRDCNRLFKRNTPEYRRTSLLSSIWMVLHNINVDLTRAGQPIDERVKELADEIGTDTRQHKHDYEELIQRAGPLLSKHNKHVDSASITLG